MGEWKKVQIGEFLFERKGRYKPDDKALSGLKRLEKIDFSGRFYIANKPSNTGMILMKSGDFVISGINVSKGAMGVYEGTEDVTATIHYSSYTFDKNILNFEYFKRFLKSAEFISSLKEQVKGGIKTEIKPKHLLPLEINLPDIKTQNNIVKHFQSCEDEINDLSSEITYQQALLKKLRQSILQEAIEGKLTADWRKEHPNTEPASELLRRIKAQKEKLFADGKIKKQKPLPEIKDEEKPFDLPEGWVWARLGEIAEGFQYGTSSKSLKMGEVPVLRMGNLQAGKIMWDNLVFTNNKEEAKKYKLKSGDLLFNRTNSRELVGKTSLLMEDTNAIFAGYLVRFGMMNKIYPEYSNIVMNSTFHREWCNEVKSDALGQSNINATKLQNFRFPLPPLSEQKTIVIKVEKLLAYCDQLEEQINSSKENSNQLIQAVLKEAFAG